MRLLHLNAGNLYGGIETMLVTLARFGGEVPDLEHRFALCFPGRLAEELTAEGAPPEMLGPTRASRPWTVWRARQALRSLLTRQRFGAVACHGSWSLGLFGTVVRALGVRLVLWAHSPAPGPAWLERLAARSKPELIIANSHFTAEGLSGRFPDADVEVLYYPVAPASRNAPGKRDDFRARLGAGPTDVVILTACRLERWKGLHVLMDALGHLQPTPGWVCWVAGGAQRDSEREYLRELQGSCHRMELTKRVRFLGQRRDVTTLMAAANLYCQPNVAPEPFGISFVEALYAGLPIVTTAMGGACEVIDRETGLLLQPDPHAISDALRRLVTDRALRDRLGGAGPSRAALLCDPGAQLRRLKNALESRADSGARLAVNAPNP